MARWLLKIVCHILEDRRPYKTAYLATMHPGCLSFLNPIISAGLAALFIFLLR
jgi:hypothetical protein